MLFIYSNWDDFCKKLSDVHVYSIPAKDIMKNKPERPYVILKHDVETDVARSLQIAKIEHKWGHSGSYYVQAYLLEDEKNILMLKKMQQMGHEISYHYDVMDSNGGNIVDAIEEFEEKKRIFEGHGFRLETICQHGNPIVERNGYSSNRDFFRNVEVQMRFSHMADIMVDFKDKACETTEYLYFSDAGRRFNLIYDPISNDIIPSDDKNIPFDNLEDLWSYVTDSKANAIISMHPHRWELSKGRYLIKMAIFKIVRGIAKGMKRIPIFRRIMSKYYYLAKKM